MRKRVFCLLLLVAGGLRAEVVTCPAARDGKKLTNAVFDEWMSASENRTMARDRKTLMPDESRVEGDDWYQTWYVTHAIEGNGLQMICQYQGAKSALFVDVKQKVSVCTLTKKAGLLTVGCK